MAFPVSHILDFLGLITYRQAAVSLASVFEVEPVLQLHPSYVTVLYLCSSSPTGGHLLFVNKLNTVNTSDCDLVIHCASFLDIPWSKVAESTSSSSITIARSVPCLTSEACVAVLNWCCHPSILLATVRSGARNACASGRQIRSIHWYCLEQQPTSAWMASGSIKPLRCLKPGSTTMHVEIVERHGHSSIEPKSQVVVSDCITQHRGVFSTEMIFNEYYLHKKKRISISFHFDM